ncbi:T9SS type B sorting domain-containing protein [Muricauda sp. SCSIO 64092]|uniref:T9SS type B sorting domain-containing protein n=1 Tax=Allomuricauda sp. SCSIO 64092 TaxID=2908842 RepID=UPI001FF4439E|nr:T9SS type B sorting domain-containing protein [Muricauda sp. SCSIO 64092]UOY07262.1 T9SS type B sorting domain-containing protein [Muricauda sp. SCSIO 64092]
MPKSNTRRLLYSLLLVLSSVVVSSAVFNTGFEKIVESFDLPLMDSPSSGETTNRITSKAEKENLGATMLLQPMFTTIIQGADEQVGCSNNGFTVARFNLCGDSDDRTITLSGGPYGSVEWQLLGGSCSPDINEDCPNTNISCYTTVATSQSFNLDASTVPAGPGAEFRVVADGQQFFFKVKKSTITQTFVKRDYICGVDGRIQITNLSSAYEFSVDNGTGFGPWQVSPIFDGLAPGTYIVRARLQNTPNTCEYPYDPIVIEQLDIGIDAEFIDAQCFGDTGSITVTVTDVPGPYRYTLLDENGIPQEFTTFISSNPYTFNAVGFGTYSVQVETQQCTGDIANGIPAPRQSLDINGNPITIGDGIVPLAASTEVNESLSSEPGCGSPNVDIIVRTSGGTAPYTFTVSDGGNSGGSYTTQTTYTVSSAGTYDFTITDANGCIITASASVQELTPPDVTVAGIDGTCSNGGARLDITVVDAKGYNLSFRASPGDPWSTDPLLSVAAGTYTSIQVQYEQGGFSCFITLPDSITVTETGAINGADPTWIDVSCNASGGVDDGSITFPGAYSGAGGGPFEFSINGSDFFPQQVFNNLSAGTYTPAVRNAAGCRRDFTAITIADIDPPTDIDFTQSNTNCAANTSDVQLTATANFAIATYEVVSPVTINNMGNDTFVGLTNNVNHTFRITDVNGCTYEESFTPAVISTIRARVKSGGDLRVCPGGNDGEATFLVDGFTNNYTYNINGGTESAPQNNLEVPITNLIADTYTITVTDVDTGCQDTASVTVEEPASPLSITPDVTAMSCANNNIGRVRANASGGFGTYRYELDWPTPPGTTQGPKSGRVFGNLTAEGTYTLRVIDAEGCTATTTFSLSTVDAPTIALGTVDNCFSPTNDGSITVSSTAGTAPLASHEYRINGGALQASPTFSGLVPGTYTVEVVDGNNCTDQLQVTIPPQIQINLDLVTEIPCGGNGEMQINISGGDISNLASTSYTIFLNGSPVAGHTGIPVPSNPFNYNVPLGSDGDYTVEVTDNNGCTNVSPPLTFTPPASILATADDVGPSCGDISSGYVEIIPDISAGTPPFQVAFAPGTGVLIDDPFNPDPLGVYNYSSQTIYSGIPAGTYEYIVKDARNCTTGVQTVTVNPDTTGPPLTTVSPLGATCNLGAVSGGIRIDGITDGVADFTIIIEDNFGNEILRRENVALADLPLDINDPLLVEGNYTVITLDSRGCIDQDVVAINSTDLDIVPDFVVPDVCQPGILPQCVEIVNGVGPFRIRLVTDPPSTYVSPNGGARRHCFADLVPGASYTVEVIDDGTNCVYFETVTIPDESTPVDVALSIDNGNCNGEDVELIYTITGTTGPFDIIIRNLDTGAIVTDVTGSTATTDTFLVPQGLYGISVIDTVSDCVGGDTVEATLNMPRVDVIDNQNANCNELGQLTVRGSGGTPYPPTGAGSLPDGSPYEYAFVDAGVAPIAGDYGTATTVYLPGTLAPGTAYDIWVRDSRGCEFQTSATIVQLDPDLPIPSITVNNQCDAVPPVGGFQIDLEMPANVDNPTFTLGGQTLIPVYDPLIPTIATFYVPSVGVYDVYVIDANGCDVTTTAEVFQLLSASGGFDTDPTCEDPDGIIRVTANGGSGDFAYRLTGLDVNSNAVDIIDPNADGVFENILPGSYQVEVTDNQVTGALGINCTTTVSNIISTAPVQPLIADTGESNISCNGANDGSINVSLSPGTDVDGIREYNLYSATLPLSGTETPVATNTSGSFVNLGQGTYVVEVVTDKLCTDVAEITITEPPVFEITASDATLTCENGVNRFSTATISAQIVTAGNGGPYGYRIDVNDSYQSSPNFDIVDDGTDQTITIYAIDSNGCEDNVTVTVFAPTDVVPSIATLSALTCVDPEQVEITVSGTSNFTVVTSGPSGTTVGDVVVTGGTTAVVDLPDAGDYLIEVQDNSPNGCSYPLPRYTVTPPTVPIVTITEANPVFCFGDPSGSLFIAVSDYSGVYNYEAFLLDVNGNRVLPAQATGSFDTANYPDVNGEEARITGLLGGNYEVSITTMAAPGCSGLSNVTTVRAPNGPLVPEAIEIGNVTCADDSGVIEANLNGGWDYAPYEYRLLRDNDTDGTFETEVATWNTTNRFENLPSGEYQVGYRDVEGCETTFAITLNPIDPILAGIREPQGLVCPDGNNAVLEAYDPTTGDALTATAGATGGVLGAGYLYQLIYLGSNNIADEISRSGLQASPTFTGASGGFISEGWYAIEVSSSYGCVGVTIPYEVDPPPPIIPDLVQVQAPGCGGIGQMRLSIENPEVGFEYEYRLADTAGGNPMDPFIRMEDNLGNPATSVLIDGVQGFYQYEVRKINATNTCGTINSNGLTLVDAQNIDLVVNQPDDISCANELDGRIESFSSGGVGLNTYTLYLGDPVDAFNPSPSAMVVQSNDFGTFEGLDAATNYFITVTSGVSCQDIEGPFTVSRPEPIVFNATATPITCNGESDGTITVEVVSGGLGLVQFAISPNFNEFFSDPDNPGVFTFEDLTGDANGREYTILIQDSEGCSETAIVEVFEPDELQVTGTSTPEICLGFADGTAQLNITGGTPFMDAMGVTYYEVSVNSTADEDFLPNYTLLFEDLQGGETYAFFIRDANGCVTSTTVPIGIGVDINAEAVVEYGCEGIFPNSTTTIVPLNSASLSDILIALDVDDISIAGTERMWADLPPGEHTAYLYHPNGCTTFVEFAIDAYEPLSVEVTKTAADEVTAVATGGFGDYEYFFQGESQGSDNVFNIIFDATINVRVVDAQGCYVEVVFPFNFEGMPEFPNFFTPDGDGLNDDWFPRNREFFPNIDVIIYDRYGRVVARLDQVKKWNGDYEGKPLPTGDYWYVVNANDNEKQQFVGHFTLYR